MEHETDLNYGDKHARFALPDRALVGIQVLRRPFRVRFDGVSLIEDQTRETTSRPLQDDLLVTMMVNKTQGPLQQHLRSNVRDLTTFDAVVEIGKKYYQSRHLANWKHMSNNHDTSGPMDIGELKGKGRY